MVKEDLGPQIDAVLFNATDHVSVKLIKILRAKKDFRAWMWDGWAQTLDATIEWKDFCKLLKELDFRHRVGQSDYPPAAGSGKLVGKQPNPDVITTLSRMFLPTDNEASVIKRCGGAAHLQMGKFVQNVSAADEERREYKPDEVIGICKLKEPAIVALYVQLEPSSGSFLANELEKLSLQFSEKTREQKKIKETKQREEEKREEQKQSIVNNAQALCPHYCSFCLATPWSSARWTGELNRIASDWHRLID
jgi:hypothetical protein